MQITPKFVNFSQNMLGEISPKYLGEYFLKFRQISSNIVDDFQATMWNISHKLWIFSHHILENIVKKLRIFQNHCRTKIYVIHLFSQCLGNNSCFFWNLSIFYGKSGISPNNGWGKFPKLFTF